MDWNSINWPDESREYLTSIDINDVRSVYVAYFDAVKNSWHKADPFAENVYLTGEEITQYVKAWRTKPEVFMG